MCFKQLDSIGCIRLYRMVAWPSSATCSLLHAALSTRTTRMSRGISSCPGYFPSIWSTRVRRCIVYSTTTAKTQRPVSWTSSEPLHPKSLACIRYWDIGRNLKSVSDRSWKPNLPHSKLPAKCLTLFCLLRSGCCRWSQQVWPFGRPLKIGSGCTRLSTMMITWNRSTIGCLMSQINLILMNWSLTNSSSRGCISQLRNMQKGLTIRSGMNGLC